MKRLVLYILLYSICATATAQSDKQEANLKAVFIYNFTKYIDWDTTRSADNFVIGVVGPSPIVGPLTEIARENRVNNRNIIIKMFNKPEDIRDCQIVFIPYKTPYSIFSILDKCGKGVLTISEEEGFAKLGTAFNFVIVNDKLKFEANIKSLYLAGLKTSSQLLKLAIIID